MVRCMSMVVVLVVVVLGEARAEPPLKVGVFAVDASPPVGSPLAYDPTKGVTQPLSCRGIVLVGEGRPVVLCAVDWIGIANDGQVEFRKALAAAAGTDPRRVAVHTLHQHDAPVCDFSADRLLAEQGINREVFDAAFAREVIARAAEAVRVAAKEARPVTHLGLGQAEVEKVASNRRILGPDGKVKYVRYTACKDPEIRDMPVGTIDPMLRMISFWDGDRPVAALTYYATHPQSYYRTGLANPDFPGMARDQRQKATGVPHVHFDGAGGNIGAGKWNDGSHENRQVLADRVAAGMARAWEATEKTPITAADLGWTSIPVALPAAPHLDEGRLQALVNDAAKPLRERGDGGQRPGLAPPVPGRRHDRRLLPAAGQGPGAPPARRVVRRVPARRPEAPARPVRRHGRLRRLRPRLHRHRGRLSPGRLRDRPAGLARRAERRAQYCSTSSRHYSRDERDEYRDGTPLFPVVHGHQLRNARILGRALQGSRHDWPLRYVDRWIRISAEQFDILNAAGMTLYKVGIILFNLVPCIVLYLIGGTVDG